ncbi:hypothetical protein QBC34DRAFT_399596 [Podospora aff. communis PSN243]|uniref:Protamine P1 n=1 Tax=Podospora aff. communis PSN243 TaxID=3040156 RepID=A0AAV9GUY9_9PEZI|nr:hypothetical protein QBC34DRAFT_399596 [Podospora aff. communis PSN243]
MRPTRRVRGTPDLAWLQTERFAHEPIYCDARTNGSAGADDVLLSGSDDEHYNSPAERRLRIEEQAHRFIEGKPPRILSAALRGPFDKKSGWTNPWRSHSAPAKSNDKKRKQAIQESPRPSKRTRKETPKAKRANARGRNATTAGRNVYPTNPASSVVVPWSSFQYLDDDVATRVIDWAESIVIDTTDNTAAVEDDGSGNESSSSDDQSPPSSALVDVGDETAGLSSSQNATNPATGSPTLKSIQIPEHLPGPSMPDVEPSRPTVPRLTESPTVLASMIKQEGPIKSPTASSGRGFIPLNITDLSPLAARAYEEQIRYSQKSPLQETVTPAQRTVIAAVAASLASAQHVADASYQTFTDRSFRFKSKQPLRKKPIGISSLNVASVELPRTEDEAGEDFSESATDDVTPSEQLAIEERIAEPMVGDCAPQAVEAPNSQPPERVATANKDYGHIDVGRSIVQDKQQARRFDEADESDASPAPSAEPPQLGAIRSPPFKSTAPNLMSLGTFSWEKEQSQSSFLAEQPGMPRKLLWPRSQLQAAAHTPSDPVPLTLFDWTEPDSSFSDASTLRGPAQSRSRDSESASAESAPSCTEGHFTTVVAPPETNRGASQKLDHSPIMEDREGTKDGYVVSLGSPVESQSCHSQSSSPVVELGSPLKPGNCVSVCGSPTIQRGSATRRTDGAPGETGPVVELKNPVEPADHASEDTGLVIELGRPAMLADAVSNHEQSPWAKDPASNPQHLEKTHNTVDKEAPGSVSEGLPELQSPWAETTTPTAKPQPLPLVASQPLEKEDAQNPWARGDSQVTAIAQPRLFKPSSSPPISHGLPEAAGLPLPSPRPLHDEGTEMACSPRLPSTPTRHNSSLPTPEFTLSIKSFREFMTPSPVKRRTPLGPADSNGRLPSTQMLADAAASNPWARPSSRSKIRKRPKKAKRVSWAPLPGEDPTSSSPGAEFLVESSFPGNSRPASPPPSRLLAPGQLPSENEKFGKHFAAAVAKQRQRGGLARRRSSGIVGTPLARPLRRGVSLLPSASQQVCESPAADAMAEAFIQADEETRAYPEGLEEARAELASEGVEGLGDIEHLEENEEMSEEEEDTQKTVDDVTDVLNNLDDFLDRWDVDAELAKARVESEKKEREKKDANSGRVAPPRQMMDIGLMEAGIWD